MRLKFSHTHIRDCFMRTLGKPSEEKNENHRIYPKEILQREIKNYIEGPIKENRALGELDHPDSSVINLNNVSHNIKKIWWEGDDVMGKIEILPTPAGNILRSLFQHGINIGISSRGMGSVKEDMSEGTVEVQDDFELLCWDFVSTPSTHGAYVKPVNINVGSEGVANLHESKIPVYPYTSVNNIIRDIVCDNTGMCEC